MEASLLHKSVSPSTHSAPVDTKDGGEGVGAIIAPTATQMSCSQVPEAGTLCQQMFHSQGYDAVVAVGGRSPLHQMAVSDPGMADAESRQRGLPSSGHTLI